jgi:hypothetical protein
MVAILNAAYIYVLLRLALRIFPNLVFKINFLQSLLRDLKTLSFVLLLFKIQLFKP